MRRQVQVPLTAMSAPEPDRKLELTPALRAFGNRSKAAAFALYTNIHACVFLPGVPEAQCGVAQSLFALGGMVETLLSSISPSSSSSSAPSELSSQDVQTLERCMALCGPVLDAVDAGVKVADEYVNPNSTLKLEKGMHRLGAFPAGAVEEQRIIQTCLHELIRVGMKVRLQAFGEKVELADEEAGESLRLETALKHADLNKSITAMSMGQNIHFVPQVLENAFPKSVIQMDAIPPPPYRRTEYMQSLSYNFLAASSNQGPLPNIMSEASKNAGETSSVKAKNTQATPASTRESTPAMDGSFVDVSATLSEAQQVNDTPGPSKGKGKASAADTTEETETTPIPLVTNTSTRNASNTTNTNIPTARLPFKMGLFERLDTYIMYPSVSTFGESTSWNLKIELLHLDESALQAYLQSMSPDPVITAMSELSPNQVRVLQARVRHRQGRLIFVQHGPLVDVVSQFGSMQARQVIFGVVTSQAPERDEEPLFGGFGTPGLFSTARPQPNGLFGQPQSNSLFGQPQSNTLFGQPQSNNPFGQPQSNSLFGRNDTNNPIQTNGPVQENRFSLPTRGLFGSPQPPAEPRSFKSAQDYENYLRERGEDCFLVEKDSHGNSIQQYMTITMENRYAHSKQDHSLEELRVEDYAAGRVGPMKINPFLYSWENPIRTQPLKEQEMPFGGQYTNPKPRQNPVSNPASSVFPSSNQQQPPSGGLFGNLGSSSQQQPISGGLFGNAASSNQQQRPSGGLFGNLPSSSQQVRPSGGLFGNLASSSQQQRPSGGLFGNLPSSSQQQQPAQPSGGLFGHLASSSQQQQQQQPPLPSGGLFGNLGSSSQQQPASGGLFGGLAFSNPQQQPSDDTSGNVASSSPKPKQKQTSGLFGSGAHSSTHPTQPSSSSSDKPASSSPKPLPSGVVFRKTGGVPAGKLASPKTQSVQPSSNLFSKAASPSPKPEQKQPTGSPFAQSTSARQPQQSPPPPEGPIGKPASSPQPQPPLQQAPPSVGLFGQPIRQTPNKAAGSLFGTPPAPPPGVLFGQPTEPQHFRNSLPSHSSYSLFGAPIPPYKPNASTSSTSNVPLPQSLMNVESRSPFSFPPTSSSASSSLFGTSAVTATAAAAAAPLGRLECKECKTSLVFHPATEQFAALCDACKGNRNTTCWLCERKLGVDNSAAVAEKTVKTEEGAQGNSSVKGKGKAEVEVKKEEESDEEEPDEEEPDEEEPDEEEPDEEEDDDDEDESSTSQPQPQSPFAFAKYKGERTVSPFATLSEGRKSSSGFSFGSSASASAKKEKESEKIGKEEKE